MYDIDVHGRPPKNQTKNPTAAAAQFLERNTLRRAMIAIRGRRKVELEHLQRKKVLLISKQGCKLDKNLPNDLQTFKSTWLYDVDVHGRPPKNQEEKILQSQHVQRREGDRRNSKNRV